MELKKFLNILKKRFSIILILLLLSITAGAIITFAVMEKKYEASTTIIINKQKDLAINSQIEYDDILINNELVKTYSIIIKSNPVLKRVADSLNLPDDIEKLRKSISVKPEIESQVIRITVQNKDSRQAMTIANTLASIFQEQVVVLFKMDNVQILDYADLPVKPTSPQPLLNLLISFTLGTLLGIGCSFIIEYFDNTVKRSEDIEQVLGLVVLGMIPLLPVRQKIKEVVNE